jgi:hypothetical protein
MKVENLKNNFLYVIGKQWVKSGSLGPYNTESIFDVFSDIPVENISIELETMQANELIALTPDKDKIYLTDKGISQIEFLISIGNKRD